MSIHTLRSHAPATLTLTRTMLEKHIIDANASIRNFAKLLHIDYDQIATGEKVTVEAEFTDGTPTVLAFYRTNNRGDRRFSIKGIKARAEIGDTIALTFKVTSSGDIVLVVNSTQEDGVWIGEGWTSMGGKEIDIPVEARS